MPWEQDLLVTAWQGDLRLKKETIRELGAKGKGKDIKGAGIH